MGKLRFKVTLPGLNYATVEEEAWLRMMWRCGNSNDQDYHNYGARGIKVCERWANDRFAFLADMGPKPKPHGLWTLGRIDNDGDYTPENCEWQTWEQQRNNTRRTRWVTAYGRRLSFAQAMREFDLTRSELNTAARHGVTDVEKIFERLEQCWRRR